MVLQFGVRLPRAPVSRDCIAWSEDCELAVACEDTVEILFPKLKTYIPLWFSKEAEGEGEKWQTVRITVNQFDDPSELRLLMPSSFEIFSIGEEQSPSTIITLAWSPVGLSRFRRCALAVLTSNLVLSIWAHNGDPTVASHWQRVLIVNHALSSTQSLTSTSNSSTTPLENNERVRTRIRSFSWSPSFKQPTNATRKDCDSFFIAITNDIGVIYVCEIRSPFVDPLNPQPQWTAKVLFHLDFLPTPSLPSTFGRVNTANYLSWSPWLDNGRSLNSDLRSCLSFALDKRIWLAELILDNDTSSPPKISLRGDYMNLGKHAVGPTRWAYHPTKSNTLMLASVDKQVFLTAVTLFDPFVGFSISQSRSRIIFPWIEISGISFGLSGGNLELYRANDWASQSQTPIRFNVSLDSSQPLESNDWHTMITCLSEAFADTDKTHPHGSIIKCWGVSSTFSNDYVALCASVHPKDVIFHARASERSCVVLILPVNQNVPTRILAPSAEATCFSVGRYIKNQCGITGDSPMKGEAFQSWMATTLSQPVNWVEINQTKPQISTPAHAVSYLRMIFQPQKLALSAIQGSIAKSIEFSSSTGVQSPSSRLFPIWTLVRAIRKMPESILRPSKVSHLILKQYCQAETLISQTWPGYFWRPGREKALSGLSSEHEEPQEQCRTCNAYIPLVDIGWAQCSAGHVSVRCGLTLLAIQEPGSSVYCGMCNTRYLTKEYLTSQDQKLEDLSKVTESGQSTREDMEVDGENVAVEGEDTTNAASGGNVEAPRSLLDILLAGCVTCIQCGGKLGVEE